MSNLDLKIVVLGPAFVGKTSIINRYCNETFIPETIASIGANFLHKVLTVDNIEINAMIWDTAGEERFRSVAPSLLRGANGLVLIFDLTSLNTFQCIDTYMQMFLDTYNVNPNATLPVLLLGNKCDLIHVITEDQIEEWKRKNKVVYSHLVSAKTGHNVEAALSEFIRSLVSPESSIESLPIQIILNHPESEKKKQCC